MISVDDPLPRGFPLQLLFYGNCMVTIQYERLPHLCFKRGSIMHTLNLCPNSPREVTVQQEEILPFGPFLLALFSRGHLLSSFDNSCEGRHDFDLHNNSSHAPHPPRTTVHES